MGDVSQITPAGDVLDAIALHDNDPCAQAVGIVVESVGDGEARLRMEVRPEMLNGFGVCHGGMTFLLADTALAYAASHTHRMHMSASGDVVFTRPAHLGDVLVATSRRIHSNGRTAIFDVIVNNSAGEIVALFRGRAVELRTDADGTERL